MVWGLVLWSLAIVAACFLPQLPFIVQLDISAVHSLSLHRSEVWTFVFKFFSVIGNTIGFLIILFGFSAFFFLRRGTRAGLFFLLGVVFLKFSSILLKVFIHRPRPNEGLIILSTYSMPSGHAVNAVFIFGLLAWLALRVQISRAAKWLLCLLCLMGIIAVDLSRVYLGVHYPSDVVIGNIYMAAGLWIVMRWLERKFPLSEASANASRF